MPEASWMGLASTRSPRSASSVPQGRLALGDLVQFEIELAFFDNTIVMLMLSQFRVRCSVRQTATRAPRLFQQASRSRSEECPVRAAVRRGTPSTHRTTRECRMLPQRVLPRPLVPSSPSSSCSSLTLPFGLGLFLHQRHSNRHPSIVI